MVEGFEARVSAPGRTEIGAEALLAIECVSSTLKLRQGVLL